MKLFGGNYLDNQSKQYLKRAINRADCEFELVYGSNRQNGLIKRDDFLRMLNEFKQKYELISEGHTLDISTDDNSLNNIRITLTGIDNIKKYCKTDDLSDIPDITYMKKLLYTDNQFPSLKFKPLIDNEYNFRINLKTEIKLTENTNDVQKVLFNFKQRLKMFRYKKRYSFLTPDKLFRIDLTILKMNRYDFGRRRHDYFKSFLDSKILNNPENYELEIEYIGSELKNDNTAAIDDFINKINIDNDENEKKRKEIYEKMGEGLNEIYQEIFEGDNVYENSFTPIDKDLYPEPEEDIYDKLNSEFNEEIIIYPENKKLVFSKSKFQDVKYEYWITSDREWLFEAMLTYDKTLHYICEKNNTDGDYKGSEKNSLYVEYEIYPKFTEDEKKEIEYEITDDFNYHILIPGEDIIRIASYKKEISWGPGKKSQIKKKNVSDNELDELDEEKKWKPEEYKINDQTPLVMFEDLMEAGEFSDDEVQWAYNSRKKNFDKNNRINSMFVIDNVMDIFKLNIVEVLKIKEGDNILLSKSEKEKVINEYLILTEQDTGKPKFLGPNPVSMSIDNIIPDRKYSIVEGYVVTEKADGIRAQLFINNDQKGYLITQKLEVIATDLQFENIEGSWLFDGEYITKNKNGNPIKLFMIFDIYYAADSKSKYPSHAYTYPWLSRKKKDICRYSILQDFKSSVEIISDNSELRVDYKNYLEGPRKLQQSKKDPTKYSNINGIFKQSKKILDVETKTDGYEYSIDGLIFMPMFLAVRSMDEGVPSNSINGVWSINYKWKPPEENTIDFKVRIVSEDTKKGRKHKITSSIKKGKTIVCKQVHLYNGYNARDDEDSDFNWKILSDEKHSNLTEILFKPEKDKLLHKCNIPIKDNKMLCLKDNSEIINNSIVEMKYNPDSEGDMRWTPLRVRSDKKYPNTSKTANNVWSTIINPVKYEYITGLENIYSIATPEVKHEMNIKNGYYIETDYENKEDESLRKLHNYIKQKLITGVCSIGNKSISILDTSMGRGGDIGKYLNSKNKINFLFGLDISPDINEAAKRYYSEKKQKPKYSMFIQYDTSESLKEGWGYKGDDDKIERNKILLDILYDKNKKIPKEYEKIEKDYLGLANKGFDIISSQFSVHYYFKNEMTLRGYLQNLSDNCKKGGFFVGTCYDGMKVFNLLKENPLFEMNDEFDNKVFSITKNYDIESFKYQSNNIKTLFNQKIEVYMNSIGQSIIEYLVNFDLFKELMEEYRFKLVTPELKGNNSGIFNKEKYYDEPGLGSFDKIIDELQSLSGKDPLLKDINKELNTRKGPYCEALKINMLKNEKLKKLSSLNNWFIFQKY